MTRLRYWRHRVRSWLYWRRFDSPGRTLDRQEDFARRNLGDGQGGAW